MLTTSVYLNYFCGLPLQGARSAWHRHEAVGLVNQCLKDPAERCQAGTLHAVALLASIEHKWGTGHEFHVAGLHQLVIHNGGLKALRRNPRFECTLFSFD
jgi:hypothetical protein